ncbi:MAG: hypothetical protein IPL26_30105 [Leptospiraceae bacterium]|nr:hypothetical protein [Leptospiraceae bacterium]
MAKLIDKKGRVYTKESVYSNVKLETGKTIVSFFKKLVNEDKNYSNETNVFSSSHGGAISKMKAGFFDTDYSSLVVAQSTIGKIKGISKLRNAGIVEFKRGKDLLVAVPLAKILQPMPILLISELIGTAPNAERVPAPVPVLNESLNEKFEYDFPKHVGNELYFNPKEQLDVELVFLGGVTIPTEVNGMILSIELEVKPFSTAANRKAA